MDLGEVLGSLRGPAGSRVMVTLGNSQEPGSLHSLFLERRPLPQPPIKQVLSMLPTCSQVMGTSRASLSKHAVLSFQCCARGGVKLRQDDTSTALFSSSAVSGPVKSGQAWTFAETFPRVVLQLLAEEGTPCLQGESF